jgi:hypothetical protein
LGKFIHMKKRAVVFALFIIMFPGSKDCLAWGKKGHELVAEIAFRFMDDSTKQIVKSFLGNLSIEEAANWMDDERSNSYYNYMRTWHYVNVEKGFIYKPTTERDIVTVLHSAILELKNYKNVSKKDIKRDLLLIFHLVGDLHQPLHVGYGSDRGGNTIDVTSPSMSGILHVIWDSQIIDARKINLDSCMKQLPALSDNEIKDAKKLNVLSWMSNSRSHLEFVYSFKDNILPPDYVDNSVPIIEKQLLLGGLCLASILNDAFAPGKEISLPGKQ